MRGATFCQNEQHHRKYFYSHASCEARQTALEELQQRGAFLLTRLMRGVTRLHTHWQNLCGISTHTPHARRDIIFYANFNVVYIFLLTRLMRGVTAGIFWTMPLIMISTHTPHARRDCNKIFKIPLYTFNFYSHASCEA